MSTRTSALLALIATVTIWGTTFVITKVALEGFHPLALSFWRFVLALVLLLPMARREHRAPAAAPPWRQLVLFGFFGGAAYFATQNIGLVYTTGAKASLILASVPALTAVASQWLLGEKVSVARLGGGLLSILGVALIVLGDNGGRAGQNEILGDLLIVGSALSWTAYTILSKGAEGRVSPAVTSAATVGFGALFLAPLWLAELAATPPLQPTVPSLLALCFLGLVASAAPFLLWNYALTKIDASEASVFINLVPLVAVTSGVVFLQEPVTAAHLLGGGIVLAGVWLASSRRVEQRLAKRASRPRAANNG